MNARPVDLNQLVTQMRLLAAEARSTPGAAPSSGEFGNMLAESLDRVSGLQREAADLGAAFERGEPGVDLAEVMVSVQKAGLSFQAVTEVRNRLVDAYKEIMNMPV